MLKIWKQAWKRGGSQRPHIGQDGDQGGQLSGASSGAPSLEAAVAVPPADANPLLSVLSHDRIGHKRTRTSDSPEPFANDGADRSAKRAKIEQPFIQDYLRNHLPEVLELPGTVRTHNSLPPTVRFEEQILDQAKRENTIAVLPADRFSRLIARLLIWAVDMERARIILPASTLHRTALLVVDHDRTIDKYLAQLTQTSLNTGKFIEPNGKCDVTPWPDLLRKDVVVTTANLFLRALVRGELTIAQLHILVITDVQNINDQDSRIIIPILTAINEFYRSTEPLSRPRILALANQPTDCKFHFDSDMLKLEHMLDARVFGISGDIRSEILALPDRPTEAVVLYDAPPHITETKLLKQLRQLDTVGSAFQHYFKAADCTLTEVGACASDLVWRRALKEIEASVTSSCEEGDARGQSEDSGIKARLTIRDLVKNWVFTMPNLDSSSRGFNVTPKFARLVQILNSCEPYGGSFRGLVFVQKRVTALAISDLLRNLGDHFSFLRPYAVVGQGSRADLLLQQEECFRAFAAGTYNLLIATKSIEDLDIPKASIVIRFDLFESQLSYGYARARTRGRESHLVHMVERGNDIHRRILARITQLDHGMRKWADALCKGQGSSVPPPTLRETTNPYTSDSEDEPDEFIKDPTTSGRIHLGNATAVIYRFAAGLRSDDGETVCRPLFKYEEDPEHGASLVSCTIMLPGSPVHAISGSHAFSISHARREACYQACLELSKKGFLDYRLFPLSSKILAPEERYYPSAVGILGGRKELSPPGPDKENKVLNSHIYWLKKPLFWLETASSRIGSLYPTLISINHFDEGSQPYAPMLILTRQPLPNLRHFKIFFSGVPADVQFRPCAKFQLDETRLHEIYMYTIRVCRAIANKPFVCTLESMAYFLAPLSVAWRDPPMHPWELPNVLDHIPWDLVSLAARAWVTTLRLDDLDNLTRDIKDAVIQDRLVEFTRRYDAIRMRPDLTPLSKPVDSPREAAYENLVEYCKVSHKGFEGLQNYEQPLIEVLRVPAVLNRLNPTSRPLTASLKSPAKCEPPALICLGTDINSQSQLGELIHEIIRQEIDGKCRLSTLRTALLLPSIMRRIDDFLLVKELNAKFFDHAISEHLLHMAISAPSMGIEYDYERLELLGDAFLKYLSSIYVFVTNPTHNEGTLHIARQRIISNKALLHNAAQTGLPSFIQAKPFSLRSWQPPNFVVAPTAAHVRENAIELGPLQSPNPQSSGLNQVEQSVGQGSNLMPGAPGIDSQSFKKRYKKRQDDQRTHWLGNKTVADVAEAIIGAAYISGGRETALKVTKALNIPVPNIDRWSDFSRKALAPPPDASAKLRPGSIQAVEAIIGHKFLRPHLLAQALTHASIQGFEATSYERLEFIGDAILDFMVIRHIFDRDGQLSPGGLTLLKGAMVSNSTLAAVCVSSGLQEHLMFESYHLGKSIQSYADQLKSKQAEEYRKAEREGRAPGQYWLETEPPKALSDVVESIIGAIYVSDDFSPVGAETLFDNILKPFYDQHITLKTLSHHPTKILFELFQAQGCQHFKIIKEKKDDLICCDVIIHEVILANATDSTAAYAARRASLFALDALEGDAGFLTRTCDCRTHTEGKTTQNKNLNHMASSFGEEEEDIQAVEGALVLIDEE